MSKIKDWQFLRSQSDRIRQINEQQTKIDQLLEKSENEKSSQIKQQQKRINDTKVKLQQIEY